MKSGKKLLIIVCSFFILKEKKEQSNFKHSSCCMLVLASHLHKQIYLIIHSYTLIPTSKKIKFNLSTDVVMSFKKFILLYLCYLILYVFKQMYITWWSAPAGRIIASPRNWITVQVFTPYSSRSLWRSFLFTYQLWSRIGSCSGKTSKPCSFAICKYRKDPKSLSKEAEPFAGKL